MRVTQEQLLELTDEQFDKLVEALNDDDLISDLNMFIAGLLPAECIELPDEAFEKV